MATRYNAYLESIAHWDAFRKEHFPRDGEPVMITLKGHLILEEQLTHIISVHCISPDYLVDAKLGFYQKVYLARSLFFLPFDAGVWDLLLMVNTIRNDYAHSLTPKELSRHYSKARTMSKKLVRSASINGSVLDSDKGLMFFMLGFLTSTFANIDALARAKKKRDS